MPDETMMKTPNEELAEQVKDALFEAGLISEAHDIEVLEKLIAGNATSEDWSRWINMATLPREESEAGHE